MSRNERYVRVKCDCGCCVVEFLRTDWDNGETDYNIAVLDSRYDHNVNGPIGRLRRAFGILLGKRVYFNDALLSQGEFDALLKALADLRSDVHADG